MKIPYGWVREFVDLRLTAAQAAERLVNAGIEVASVTPLAPDLKGVVVGEIEAIERELGQSHGHTLVLCRVSAGREHYAVVCGAPNARAGLRAAFAPPGAVLPGGRRIASAKIHGVESQGMLCSEKELGIGEEHEAGILEVAGARSGADLVAALGLDDHVLEVEITPNRPDCLSVLGIARELAALTGGRLRPPQIALKESGESAKNLARVRIEAPDLCHRFTARVISGVTIGPSPAWLRTRLRAIGLRPISNVVDATNYVLWELGQPLHAYDYATRGRLDDRRAPRAGRRALHDPRRPGARARRVDAAHRRPAAGDRARGRDGRRQHRGHRRHDARAAGERLVRARVDPPHLARARSADRRRVPVRARRRHRGPRDRLRAGGGAHRRDRRRHASRGA